MMPRALQLPMWMWETCFDIAWRPVILSSTVSCPGAVVTVMVPVAVVLMPLSLNTSPTGDGVDAGIEVTGLDDGDGDAEVGLLVPVAPQAAATKARGASAPNLRITEFSAQVCSRRYP